MAAIDWAVISRLVPEVALVVIFMWYTRERDKAYAEAQKQRDSEWREFMKEERAARAESTARIAEEVKSIAGLMSSNQALLIQHDSYTRMVGGQLVAQAKPSPAAGTT